MTIKVVRNEAGNCINFEGTTVPAYFNACLSAQANGDIINIKNDIRSKQLGRDFFEFSGIPFSDFRDADGNSFASAQAAADYITLNGNVSAAADINVGYLGAYNASTNQPDITTDLSQFNNGDWYFVTVAANSVTLGSETYNLKVNDQLRFDKVNQTWNVIKDQSARINGIESSALTKYDWHVDANYTGVARTGTILHPFVDLSEAIAASSEGDTILLKGDIVKPNTTDDLYTLPHSLHFYGSGNPVVRYSSYDETNGNVFIFEGTDNTQSFTFEDVTIQNAGKYGVLIKKAKYVDLNSAKFNYNGWNGTGLNTVVPSTISGVLGYDSSQAELQAFYAGPNASNGGAARIEEATDFEITACRVSKNLRGIRVQDCGVNGYGFITRNIAAQNIESGIYLAAGATYGGCQNVVVSINSSAYNSNNGLLVIGGLNNKFSQNEVKGNWNAGFCNWGAANSTLRDAGLYDNNRSAYNGIGNIGDAKASIQINDAYNLLGTTLSMNPDARFIVEILDTQVQNTGLGSNTDSVGFLITEDVGNLAKASNNIIKVDDVGFIGQDYAIDFSEVDLNNLHVTLGDNSYINIGETAVKEPLAGDYYELPFSNHVTDLNYVDVSIDLVGNVIIKEGPNGQRLNPYKFNDLEALPDGDRIKVLFKGSNKIQFTAPVSGITIDGNYVNSVQNAAIAQLNGVFENTVGFASNDNYVTDFVLAGNNLTITLQDSTSYTVDITTLGVDENKFVSSGAVNGTDLELTMNDASVITIDISNMVNGSSLPSLSNNWFISYGGQAGNQVAYPSIVADLENRQPFYNGDFLEKGEEYVWTHDVSGYYLLGIYTGAQETSDENEITFNNKWSHAFKFLKSADRVSETSVGVDVASRYATGYNVTNNTVLALSYDTDNYLRLFDISNGGRVLIGQSNTALVGDSQIISFGGQNQPNAKFPVMIKRYSQWTIVHDFDNSETTLADGINQDTVIKSNISISPNEKILFNLNFAGRASRFGIGYDAASSGNTNAHTNIVSNLAYGTSEQLVKDNNDWDWNTGAQFYNASGPNWSRGNGVNAGLLSLVYNSDNSLELYSEEVGEVIATKAVDLDGSPIHFYFGVNENTTVEYIPAISKQTLGQGSQPITSFAPDISDQSFDVTRNQPFNVQIALDSGSDIVNQYVELDAPTWTVLNQQTGLFNGTAPDVLGTHVINCKAANAIGGSVSFEITINVVEPVYTNTKSLKFRDGVNSYLGGNAALVTALERSGNGSGSSEAWTIGFVYKTGGHSTGQTLFYFGNSDLGNQGYIEIKNTSANRIRFRYGSNNNYLQLSTNSGPLTSGWNFVLISYDGGTTGSSSGSLSNYYSRFKIAVNGVQQVTTNSQSNYGWSGSVIGQNFRFGKLTSGNYPKDGLLNQLAIWNSDQSSNLVGLYNGGSTQDLTLPVAGVGNFNTSYLPPNHYYEIEDSHTTVQDLIGNAHLVGYNFTASDLIDDAP